MQVILFAILGLGTGAVYAMLAQGLVLIYRGLRDPQFCAGRHGHGGRIHLPPGVGARGRPLFGSVSLLPFWAVRSSGQSSIC